MYVKRRCVLYTNLQNISKYSMMGGEITMSSLYPTLMISLVKKEWYIMYV